MDDSEEQFIDGSKAIYGTRDEIWWDIRYTYRKDRLARNNTIPNSSELFTLTSRFCFSLVFSFSWPWLGDPWKMLVSRKVYTPSCCRVFFYNSSWRVSFVIFAPFFSRGQDNGWNYEKLEDGASSSAQHAHVTWRGNTTAVGRRSNRGIWIIESVDACLTILDFWSLGQHQQQWSHEWPDILSGDNRYRYRYALCFAALFDDTLGAHLGGPVFTEDLLVYQTEVTKKTPCSCEAWATLPICWTSKSRQQKLFLSKKRINTCKGWKDLFCTWLWFQSRNFKSLVPLAGHECFCFFFKARIRT